MTPRTIASPSQVLWVLVVNHGSKIDRIAAPMPQRHQLTGVSPIESSRTAFEAEQVHVVTLHDNSVSPYRAADSKMRAALRSLAIARFFAAGATRSTR
jgi:hypothetical protein